MNIIEAIKSGKPFKRPYHSEFYTQLGDFAPYGSDQTGVHICNDKYDDYSESLEAKDILAEDWETKDENA